MTGKLICALDNKVYPLSPSFESILLSLPGGGTILFGIPARMVSRSCSPYVLIWFLSFYPLLILLVSRHRAESLDTVMNVIQSSPLEKSTLWLGETNVWNVIHAVRHSD